MNIHSRDFLYHRGLSNTTYRGTWNRSNVWRLEIKNSKLEIRNSKQIQMIKKRKIPNNLVLDFDFEI